MRQRQKHLFFVAWGLGLLFLGGCPGDLKGELPPQDHPHFPSGFQQQGDRLFVVSSNGDLRYRAGAVLSIDLLKVDARLAPAGVIKGEDVVTSSVFIPSFAEKGVLAAHDLWLLPSREHNELLKLDLKSGEVACSLAQTPQMGQDCGTGALAVKLEWSNPRFLVGLDPKAGEKFRGLLGYLSQTDLIQIEPDRPNLLDGFGELQVVTQNAQGQVQIAKTFLLHDFMPDDVPATKTPAPAPAPTPTPTPTPAPAPSPSVPEPAPKTRLISRRVSEISALQVVGDNVFVAVEARLSYGDFIRREKTARLIWFPIAELEKDKIDKAKVKAISLTGQRNIEKMNGAAFVKRSTIPRGDLWSAYILADEPSALVRVDLTPQADGSLVAEVGPQVPTCERPTTVAVSRDGKVVLVGCEKSNEIVAYDPDTLQLIGSDKSNGLAFGRGPVQIEFDTRATHPTRFYVSYYDEGTIGVFEVNPGNPGQVIKRLGRIFEQAPYNHRGGV